MLKVRILFSFWGFVPPYNQRCHSTKIKKPSWANKKKPRKPKVTFLYIWLKFLDKIVLFLKKPNFSRKNSILSAKISDDLFLFFNFDPRFRKPKLFQKTLEKTQGCQKKPKNPKLDRRTQDLGRKPKWWQR